MGETGGDLRGKQGNVGVHGMGPNRAQICRSVILKQIICDVSFLSAFSLLKMQILFFFFFFGLSKISADNRTI